MSHKFRLVVNNDDEERAKRSKDEWALDNAQQLALFNDPEHVKVLIVSMANEDAHSFVSHISSIQPVNICDTRIYPDFYGQFESTKKALSYFHDHHIMYLHTPISIHQNSEEAWAQKRQLIRQISSWSEKVHAFDDVFVILVAQERMKSELKGQLEQLSNEYSISVDVL